MGLKKGQTNAGSIKKGEVRNPDGRPKADTEWKEWCRQFADKNREHIEARAKENDKLLAFLIEQGHGRAAQAIEHSGTIDVQATAVRIAEAVRAIPGAAAKVVAALEGDAERS